MSDIPEFYDEYTLTRYTYKDHDRLSETTVTFRAEDLPEILEQFRYFLLGCSFTYVSEGWLTPLSFSYIMVSHH